MRRPIDTGLDGQDRQVGALRAMTPAARLRLADAMSIDVRSLARAGIRARHPDYSAEEVEAAFVEIMLGATLALAVRSRPAGAR